MAVKRAVGLSVQPGGSEPIYQQIFDQIVERIESRAFPPGYRLPPSRLLAEQLDTHRNTVVRSYVDLEAAGFVVSTVGKGTFVASTPPRRAPRTPAPREGARLPWSSLVTSRANAESLSRAPRLSRKTEGRDLVNLTRMQPSADLLPAEMLRRAMDHVLRTVGARALAYAPPDGLPRLRELIAQDLVAQGVPAKAEDIVVTTGSQQALDVIARALIEPGDTFLVDSTTYTGAINLLTMSGARLVPVPSDDEGPDIEFLARMGRSPAKGFYLMPNCHNPTSVTVSEARRRALVAFSHDAGVPLIEDDYGADLALTDDPPPPALRALDGDVIYTGTFSKKLVPALRVGFIVCPEGLRPQLSALKHAMDLGTSVLLQHALAEFMERGYLRAHIRRTLPEYRLRRDALVASLSSHLPTSMPFRVPERGVVLWLPLPKDMLPEVLYEEAYQRGVLVSPSTLNAVTGTLTHGVRLTFCAESAERVAEGGKRLGEAVKSLLARRPSPRRRDTAEALESV